MKNWISFVLAAVLMLSMSVGAAAQEATVEDMDLMRLPSVNNDKTAQIIDYDYTDGFWSATVEVNTPWDPVTDQCHGMSVLNHMEGVDLTQRPFVHLSITADVPFRVTILDRSDAGDKWISFAGEFFNSVYPDGTEPFTTVPADYFFPAGTYNCVAYLQGYYDYWASHGRIEYDASNVNITAINIEAKEAGTITVNGLRLSASNEPNTPPTEPGTTTTTESPMTTTTTAGTTTTTEATPTTTTAAETTTSTTVTKPTDKPDSPKTGDESTALVLVAALIGAAALSLSIAASKKAKIR